MRSQLRFVMHADDECAFVDEVLKEQGALLGAASGGNHKRLCINPAATAAALDVLRTLDCQAS